MNRLRALPASTLVEMLVLMLLSGIVFLSVMDGLRLLRHHLIGQGARIGARSALYGDYFRLHELMLRTDSIVQTGVECILWERGRPFARIARADSGLRVSADGRTDTLFDRVAFFGAIADPFRIRQADTILVGFPAGSDSSVVLRFSPSPRRREIPGRILENEKKYAYEEE